MPYSTASLPHKRSIRYSLAWGEMILQRFYNSHPRARDLFLQAFALQDSWLAYLIACGDPDWPALRALAHTWDKWHGCEGVERADTKRMYSTLVRIHKNSFTIGLLAYMQARIGPLD